MLMVINQCFLGDNSGNDPHEERLARTVLGLDEHVTTADSTMCAADDCRLLSASDDERNAVPPSEDVSVSNVNDQSPGWWTDYCSFSTDKIHQALHDISADWYPTSLAYGYQRLCDLDTNLTAKRECNQGQWGHDWGLCPWRDGIHTGQWLKDKQRSPTTTRQCKPKADRSYCRRRCHKSFAFHHVSDFKEYIRQYREKHTQAVISQSKEQRTTQHTVGSFERALAPSSVAQVTDLTSLLPTKESRFEDKHSLKSSIDQVITPITDAESSSRIKENQVSLRFSYRTGFKKYGCSKGLSVFRKSVDLSPLKMSLSSPQAFNPVTSVALIKRDDIIRRPSNMLSSTGKYLNLKVPKHEISFELKKTRKKETPVMSVKNMLLDFRKMNCGTGAHDEDERSKSEKVSEEPLTVPLQLHKDSNISNVAKAKNGKGSSDDCFGSLYLGFCLNQLSSSSSAGSATNGECEEVKNNMAAYQLTGRQLRGKPLIPRPGRETLTTTNVPVRPMATKLYSTPGGLSPRVENVKLGIQGNNLKCQHQTANTLGIFDMPV